MTAKPKTAGQWREHAEMLHGRGLEAIDRIDNMGDVPTDVAHAHLLRASTLFAASQSASAMAGYLRESGSTTNP